MKIFRFLKQIVLTTLLIFWPSAFCQAGLPALSPAEIQALSPAEREAYQKEFMKQFETLSPKDQQAYMEQVAQAMYESLSPEEQQQVRDEVAKVEAMSPKEQEAYLANLQKEIDAEIEKARAAQEAQRRPQPTPAPTPAPAPKPVTPPKTEKPTKKEPAKVKITAEEKSIKEALQIINELLSLLESFMEKIEAKEDFSNKLNQWGKKKKIKSWAGGYDWNLLKAKIEQFAAQLEKLKSRDSKTKEHQYLRFLINDEDTYTKLYNLGVDFFNYEPSVRVRSTKPLTKSVRKKSHRAIRELLDALSEALVSPEKPASSTAKKKEQKAADLIAALENIFKKYDPEAAKAAGEEEKIRQRALRESKRPMPRRRVQVVGETGGDSYAPHFDEGYASPYDRGAYRGPAGAPYRPGATQTQQTRRPESRKPSKTPSKKPGSKKGEKPDSEKIEQNETKLKTDRTTTKLIRDIDQSLDVVVETIEENANLANLESYFKRKVLDTDLVTQVPAIERQLRRATSKLQKAKKRLETLPARTQVAYEKDIKASIEEHKEINEFARQIGAVYPNPKLQGELPDNMKRAHFGEGPDPDQLVLRARTQLEAAKETEAVRRQASIAAHEAQLAQAEKYKKLAEKVAVTIPQLKETVKKYLETARKFTGR